MNSEQPGASGRGGIGPGVDLDLLADYAGGALEGTPEQARAAALVESDPVWADALDSLRAADTLVRADLSRLADTTEPIPTDIAARLAQALENAAPFEDSDTAKTPRKGQDEPARLRHARIRRRRYRIAAVAAVAAGLLGLAVPAGYLVLAPYQAAETSRAPDRAEVDSGAEQPDAATEGNRDGQGPAALGRGYPVPVAASGTDYTRVSLSAVHGRQEKATADAPSRVPEGLSRLVALPALEDCLTAIRSAHPGTVTIVDYARFEGAPALIVAVTEAAGGNRVVVAGPGCGRSGADERYTATE
ncbi:MAG TPA: hypothetical protein VFZ32_08840 [Micromonosporaceae bacterium]